MTHDGDLSTRSADRSDHDRQIDAPDAEQHGRGHTPEVAVEHQRDEQDLQPAEDRELDAPVMAVHDRGADEGGHGQHEGKIGQVAAEDVAEHQLRLASPSGAHADEHLRRRGPERHDGHGDEDRWHAQEFREPRRAPHEEIPGDEE